MLGAARYSSATDHNLVLEVGSVVPDSCDPKCSIFKSFIFLHHLGLGLCSHMDFSPLWGPQKDRGYVAPRVGNIALCLTLLLAGLLVQLCTCRSTLLFFISDEW